MLKLTSKISSLIFFMTVLLLANQAYCAAAASSEATVEQYISENKIMALSENGNWYIGEKLAVVSAKSALGVIAFVEVQAVAPRANGKFELSLTLQRQSRKYFVLIGDYIKRVDLSRTGANTNTEYIGATDLLIRKSPLNISPKYRPLVHQGFIIGDTAQTLFEKEFLLNYFANLYYGYNNWLTFGTLLPANAFGRPNANFRAKFYESEATTLTVGMSGVRLLKEDEASLNLNFYWDATSSDTLIAHTFLSFGLINWKDSGEAAAIKYLTSSTFQTGYEAILDNWDRILVGPSYNFEKKSLGGYLSYIWIGDLLHLQLSLNATDVTRLRLDPTDGYYGFFDVFWRF